MKGIKHHLQRLSKVKRSEYHPLLHKIHKKHGISHKTLFYVKEYGPRANVPKTIVKESLKVLLIASVVSSLGGLALEHVKTLFLSLMPLVIVMPTLNDMIGDYAIIVSSRFSTMLHEGKITRKTNWLDNPELRQLFIQVFFLSIATAIACAALSSAIAVLRG
ncbi:MAG: hypothetical protein V1717_03400, partial [Candidatus Micrarchaeota archaeon]